MLGNGMENMPGESNIGKGKKRAVPRFNHFAKPNFEGQYKGVFNAKNILLR
jgi:hypothetical protein